MTVTFLRKPGFAKEIAAEFNAVSSRRIRPNHRYDVLWRWGCFDAARSNFTFNSNPAMSMVSDKPRFRQLATEQGIRIPQTFYSYNDALAYLNTPGHGRLIGRPRHHTAGRDLYVIDTPADLQASRQICVYWSVFIPKTKEVRVFVMSGRVVMVNEKVVEDRTQIAWNHSEGSTFVNVRWGQWPSAACHMAIKIANAAGVDFSAVDLIYHDHYWYLLEANNAPAMTTDYKMALMHRCVEWLESYVAEHHQLPPREEAPTVMVKGYQNYIHSAIRVGG